MAFQAHLRLFIEDIVQSEPSIISRSMDCCALFVFDAISNGQATYEEAVQMIDFLTAHDFPFDNHADCLADALLWL